MQILLFFWLMLLFMGTSPIHAQKTLHLTTGEEPPLVSARLPGQGTLTRIVRDALAEESIELEVKFFPWKRAFMLAKYGQWQGTFGWFLTPERQRWFYYSDPILMVDYVFFYRKFSPMASFDWQNYRELSEYKIGGILGYNYGPEFMEAEDKSVIHVQRFSNAVDGLERLEQGNLDLALMAVCAGEHLIKRYYPKQVGGFDFSERSVYSAAYYLLINKEIPNATSYIERFNRGFRKLKARDDFNRRYPNPCFRKVPYSLMRRP